MRIRLESRIAKLTVLTAVAGLLILYCGLAWSRYRAARVALNEDLISLQRITLMQPGDAEYRERLARYYLYVDQNAAQALKNYQRAVSLNPYSARGWLGIAQAELILGDEMAAKSAVDRALNADPNTPSIAWEAGNLLIAAGQVPQALQKFRFVLANDPGMRIQALQLVRRLEDSPSRAAELALPPDPDIHFNFINLLAQSGDLEAAKQVWPVVMRLRTPFEAKQSFFLLSALIRSGDGATAFQYWEDMAKLLPEVGRIKQPDNLIRNGSFEYPILNGGFDWTYLPSTGADLRNELSDAYEGKRSLLVRFHGVRTSDIGTHQYLLLEPNTHYKFKGYIKANLQTANGFRFMIVDSIDSKRLLETDEAVDERQWKELSGEFTTGANTRMAVLLIGRNTTSLVSGTLQIDDLTLSKEPQ